MTITSPAPQGTAAGENQTKKKGGRAKKLIVMLVVLLVMGGATYAFALKPKSKEAPKPGEVVKLEPISVNLQDGHYLKIGIALQLTADAKEVDGSKALDATIEEFSGRDMSTLTEPKSRQKLKEKLEKELKHGYDGEVMGVYFTDFVTQ